MIKKTILSKSRIMSGLQCEKKLYLEINNRETAGQVTPTEQARFDAGNEVGEEARKRYPGGVLIDAPHYDRDLALKQTVDALNSGANNIFEASFVFNDVFARIDILHRNISRNNKNSWDIIEVKSTTKVKEQHLYDIAVQSWIFINQGLPLNKCFVMHLNNQCIYPNLDNLFCLEDVTAQVEELISEVKKSIGKLKSVVADSAPPPKEIGPHCFEPYDCQYAGTCWKDFPEKNIFELPGLGKKAWDLFNQGHRKIKDLNPEDFKGKTKRAIEVTIAGKRHLDRASVKESLKSWQWPLYFFDFETIGPAIPRYNGTKPYSPIPFQFSCHVMKSKASIHLEHFEYLHTDITDPREPLVKSLSENFGPKGSVVSYNKSFENGVLNKLADLFPKHRRALLDIASRLVDPLPIFQNHIYDEEFLGSFSIKNVAPAIIGKHLKYDELEVSDGTEAGAIIDLLMTNKISDKVERQKQTQALLEYCRQDTLAMVELVKWLFAL